MTQIGTFKRTESGYTGTLRTLTLDAAISIVPIISSGAEKAPDYRLYLGDGGDGIEVGAGWKHSGEKAGEFVSILIDNPTFTQTIRANLFQSEANTSQHYLVWNRPSSRKDQV